MRILHKTVLDIDPDAAWRAVHSPRAAAELYGPFLQMRPIDGLPTSWEAGAEAAVTLTAAGIVPMGTQLLHVFDDERADASGTRTRIFRDAGAPLTGPLALLRVWDHQMAISPAPGEPGRTLWRERLVIGGAWAPVFWPVLWTVWRLRAARLRRVAPTWAHDPAPSEGAPDA